ncbi:MAG: aminoacyl-tRNA hydrolase [Patescibacteria group bacterium]|nr:aminoacyl-tRNA hydrolase [Patescibacteria group bacterium]
MNSTFYCVVGLGNPGKQYYHTRHNIGFRIVEFFVQAKNVDKSNSKLFSFSRKHNAELAKFQFGDKKLILVKPQTYMNRSGHAVQSVISYFNIPLENLIVANDDIDIILGSLRFSKKAGSAGHKGVRSIIEQCGSQDFVRLRFGIAKNSLKKTSSGTDNFVLACFDIKEEKILRDLIPRASESIEFLLNNGFEKTANKYNKGAILPMKRAERYRRENDLTTRPLAV